MFKRIVSSISGIRKARSAAESGRIFLVISESADEGPSNSDILILEFINRQRVVLS